MEFSREVLERFPGISVVEGDIKQLSISIESSGLERLKAEVAEDIRSRYTLEGVKDDPTFRAYRDFFWSVGIDPTKTRPASEALIRRLLSGGGLPRINTAVDAYNLASALSGVPIAAFDADKLDGSLLMRFAHQGEAFLGIGMKAPISLKPNQVVLTDGARIIAIYPYRDSDDTKVTQDTRNIHLVCCGVPNINKDKILRAYTLCAAYLKEHASGTASEPAVYP
ncbi:B3/B4 domain-containing protein [Methanocella conradii]|uniref:B3/B4 domain-containing protein n=1 Tax=Methanocella conradii TaxID=1175444 RepID=UPI00157D9406|nr:phenylalanine--tRNA ligase beta subunit-related protein [Methanocella conradii]